jgi:hypothetical protein
LQQQVEQAAVEAEEQLRAFSEEKEQQELALRQRHKAERAVQVIILL